MAACARKGTLTCADQGPVKITEGGETRLDLELSEGRMLEVRFLRDGEPTRAHLRVLDAAGRSFHDMFVGSDLPALLTEGFSTMRRVVGPLPPGTYTLIAATDDGRKAEREVRIDAGSDPLRVALTLE